MPLTNNFFFQGWRLTVLTAALELLGVAAGLAILGFEAEGWHWALRWTARLSAILFLIAFLASTLRRLIPRPGIAWLLKERRYIGLAFASSQLIHLMTIGGGYRFAANTMGPVDFGFILGAVAYGFTALLALTSNDFAVRKLGPRTWHQVHSVGMYFLWFIFTATYLMGATRSKQHLVFGILFIFALILKLGTKGQRRFGKGNADKHSGNKNPVSAGMPK